LQTADAFVFLIGGMLQVQHLYLKLSLSSSIGNALGNLLIPELVAF